MLLGAIAAASTLELGHHSVDLLVGIKIEPNTGDSKVEIKLTKDLLPVTFAFIRAHIWLHVIITCFLKPSHACSVLRCDLLSTAVVSFSSVT